MTTYSQHFQHTITIIIFILLFWLWSLTNSQISDLSLSFSLQISNYKKPVPNLEDFLKELDKAFEKDKFTCYFTVFKE